MMRFKDIVGQDMIKEHLQGALSSGKTSHAYIINGEKTAVRNLLQIFLLWHCSVRRRAMILVVNV